MKDFGSREDRSISKHSIRVQLRTVLRRLGIKEKFRTDIHRDGTLLVISNVDIELPITMFENHPIKFLKRSK